MHVINNRKHPGGELPSVSGGIRIYSCMMSTTNFSPNAEKRPVMGKKRSILKRISVSARNRDKDRGRD
jgi:hypothetical protein